jgi:tetraacyldisaccharide 4'-kinase
MLPSVTTLVTRQLASRLWERWFGPLHANPWKDDFSRPVGRLLSIRQRRARNLSRLVWWLTEPLLPLAARLTRWEARRRGRKQCAAPKAPSGIAIAVGNWIPGGAGKTPICIALAQALRSQGRSPAILTRGYRLGSGILPARLGPSSGKALSGVRVLTNADLAGAEPADVGDEAWLMAWRSGCPVGIGSNRLQAAQTVLSHHPQTDIWILDDGLSQTSLCPDLRVLVLDSRGHGNGRVLPDGPLRGPWPPEAALNPQAIIAPESLDLEPILKPFAAHPPQRIARRRDPGDWLGFTWGDWPPQPEVTNQPPPGSYLAIAGIAQPDHFFDQLRSQGLSLLDTIALPDHANEILPAILRWKMGHAQADPPRLVMTEKDAVKFAWETRSACLSGDASAGGLGSVLADFGAHWWAQRLNTPLPDPWIAKLASRQTTKRNTTHGRQTS